MFIRALLLLVTVLCVHLLPQLAWAAACGDIWPDRDTSNASVTANLPVFSGSSSLNLPATLGAGDFHYSSTTQTNNDLSVNGGASTRIYINGNLILGGNTDLNQGGNPEDLIIIVNGDLNINNSNNTVNINAIIYATGNVNLNNDVSVTGAVTAEGWVNNANRISYDNTAVANADFGTLCGGSAPQLNYVALECGRDDRLIVSFLDGGTQTALSSSAELIANYSLVSATGSSIAITDAELADNGFEVILTLAQSVTAGTAYTLSVSNISDENGFALASDSASVVTTTDQTGIAGAYFTNSTLTSPAAEYRVDSEIDFSWNPNQTPFGAGTNGFSMAWQGFLEVPADGNYQFRTYSDDGVRFWIDDLDQLDIENWSDHSSTLNTGTSHALVAGERYPIKMDYYNRSANGEYGDIRLDWSRNGSGFSTVPSSAYFTCRSAPSATNGLVVQYNLDGPLWNGTANEVLDSSGLDVHGSIVNGAANVPAKVCNGVELDGSNFLRVQDHPSLDLSDELTVTAWIKLDASSNQLRTILSKDENYEFHIDRNGEIYWWWNSNAGTRSFDTGSTRITLHTWHHVAIVYADGRQSIYLDGNEAAYRTYSGETLVTNADPLEIGADQGISARNWVGQIDEIRIYKQPLTQAEIVDVMNETRVCSNTLDGFSVSAAESASVCSPTTVTLTALRSDGSTYTGFTGTVDLTTSAGHGNWSFLSSPGSAYGMLNPNPDSNDDGGVQYTFVSSDNGSVQLSFENTHADSLVVNALENGGSASGVSNTITFSENALQIDIVDPWGSDVVAGRDHQLRVQAWKRDTVTGDCGLFTEYNGDIDLKAWITRGAEDPAGVAPAISALNGNVSLGNSVPASDNIQLRFSAGEAYTNWMTSDVGQYALNLQDDSSGMAVDLNGDTVPMSGSLGQFVVRPFGLYLEAVGNPGAVDENGDAFVAAGQPFALNVTAVTYDASDDGDGDHHPDDTADLSANGVTAAFGQEGGGSAEQVALNATLLQPVAAGARDPGLLGTTTVSAFTSGQGSSQVRYDEVGIIEINGALIDGSYLGSGINLRGHIQQVGRFYPAYFTVIDNAPTLRDGNGGWTCPFTYQGQAFGFAGEPVITVQAYNLNDEVTQNYASAFWKLNVPQHTITLEVASLPTGSACEDGGAIASGCFTENSNSVSRNWTGNADYDGNGSVVTGSHVLTINKLNARPDSGDVPYSPQLTYGLTASELTDADGACYEVSGSCSDYQITPIAGTELRWGRGWVDNVIGSVLTPLPMSLRLQYWNGSEQFQLNQDDDASSCTGTQVLNSDLNLGTYTGQLEAGETTIASLTALPGYYVMTLSAPGYEGNTANTGSVSISWALDTWLQYDFDLDAVTDQPIGVATFVGQPANQPLLFKRESYR